MLRVSDVPVQKVLPIMDPVHVVERIEHDLWKRAEHRHLGLLRYRNSRFSAMRSVRNVTASPIRRPLCRIRSTNAFNRAGVPFRYSPVSGYRSQAQRILSISSFEKGSVGGVGDLGRAHREHWILFHPVTLKGKPEEGS